MDKHTKIRVESWCRKFCQITNNTEWKKNRNLHAICLLDMIINEHYEEPYNRLPPDGPLPLLQRHIVTSKLSKKFWNYSKTIFPKPTNNYGGVDINIDYINKIKTKNDFAPNPIRYKYKNLNKKNNFSDIINKCNNPDLLKKIIEKLENKINEVDDIIIQQDEERNQFLKRIEYLEKLIKPYLKNNKY